MHSRNGAVESAAEGAVSAATSTQGLPHGTVLGRARIGDRTVVYAVDSGSSIWCTDAGYKNDDPNGQIGVVQWRDGVTPHMRLAPRDVLNADLAGRGAELTVVCAMALWRRAFEGQDLPPDLPAQPNPALANRRAREVSHAGR
ncbi:hypothetical protein AB0A73_21810 [Glycomyces sp. NPDC047369]